MKFSKSHASILCLGTALAFVAGCGKKGDQVRNEIEQKAAEFRVDDTWTSSCQNAHLDIFGLSSQIETYDIGSSLNKTTTFYNEDNCAVPVLQIVEHGVYDIGDKTVEDAFIMNTQYETVTVTPLNEDGKNILKTLNACGTSDWNVGQPRDVTAGTSDNPVLARCWTKTPRSHFDIVKVESDRLKFGLANDGKDKSAPEKRPVQLDQENVFTRQ